ncbi:MAG: HD domain-containing protein [Candidatus Eisenbacteria bacterium]
MNEVRPNYTMVLAAAEYEAEWHKHGKPRKDANKTPYINHPIAVARLLADEGAVDDPEVLAAALLHDVIEDTPVDATELRARFGERVTRIVLDVSDDKRLDKPVRKELQVQHAPHLPADSKLVKLADKICNLRDVANNPPSHWDLQRRREYFAWAERVVAGLRGTNAALDRVYDEAAAGRP